MSVKYVAHDDIATGRPTMTASARPMRPITVASPTCPGPELVHVQTHEQRERNRDGDREHAPRALGERIDERESDPGERDDDDEEDGDAGRESGDRTNFRARNLGERRALVVAWTPTK